jgi:hypothetical protein
VAIQGRTVDFKNSVNVMTSNLGSQMIQQMAGDDYQVFKLAVMGEVKTYFRPEFINRIDETVVFHALSEGHIASIQLHYLEARVAKMEMTLEVSDASLAGTGVRRIRSGVWRPAAQARHPAGDRKPAGEGDTLWPLRAQGHHPGGGGERPHRVRVGDRGGGRVDRPS